MKVCFAVALVGAVMAVGCSSNDVKRKAATPSPGPVAEEDAGTAWDPMRPVDLATLDTHHLFVVAEKTPICPTRAGVLEGHCGNSNEFPNEGYWLERGARVPVVGPAPRDGMWRSIRYMVPGTMPGWIAAEDLAEKPDLSALDAFDAAPTEPGAIDATEMTITELRKLRPGKTVVFRRLRASSVRFGVAKKPPTATIFLELPRTELSADRSMIAVKLPSRRYIRTHACLFHGDCLTLRYKCDETFCDSISIAARTTNRMIAPPPDPEGEWPDTYSDKMRVLRAVRLADRFGTFP